MDSSAGHWIAQLEAEAGVRKLEKELRLEKDVRVPTTLLAHKMQEQGDKLETLACMPFCKTKRAQTTVD